MSRRPRLAAAASLAALIAQLQPATAADLLRRGAGTTSGGGSTGASTETDSAAGALRDQTLVNNREALARTNRTLQDLARLQTAARAAALAGAATVPNGLAPGGLVVAPGATPGGALWNGASAPTQNVLNGLTKVRVSQTAPQALLTWQTFNIGRETELTFDQSAGGAERAKWIVFNQIEDPSGAPSQILGALKADGQVYVINRNGVVFGGSSQVNVRGLTVSTLPINQNLVDQGLLNNPDGQFLFSGLAQVAGPSGAPAIPAPLPPVSTGRFGDIVIEAGAVLESPLNSDGGGRIALVGANVRNDGVIKTPEGQTILAAGLQVGLTSHDSADASLRGLDAYVGQVGDYAGSVVNNGLVATDRGNATLVGREISVAGAITSTTSVDLNGRIDLLAAYDSVSNPAASANAAKKAFNPTQSGHVSLGENAVLSVLPELESKDTVAASALALRSQVNLQGRTIHLDTGSTILAPNAVVNLDAGVWLRSVLVATDPSTSFLNAEGQIYLDQDSLISVAGSAGVKVPVSQNIVAVELRGAELSDSPLLRNSFLRGQTIYVDIRESGTYAGVDWIGTPMADASGYIGLIERTVGQLTTDAGEINLRAGGSVVLRESSRLDVSAGWVDFQGGYVSTTKLLKDGRLIDIADASPDVSYDGIYTGRSTFVSPRWGISSTYSHPIAAFTSRHEDAYSQSAGGGSIKLVAAGMALDGAFSGFTIAGPRQREKDEQPRQSSLSLDFTTRDITEAPTYPAISPTPPRVTFATGSAAPAGEFALDSSGAPEPLPSERLSEVSIAPDLLVASGLGNLAVNNPEGDILLPENTVLAGPAGGSLSLTGANVSISGDIIMSGGSVSLTARNVPLATLNGIATGDITTNPPPSAGRGVLLIAAGAHIDVAGDMINELTGAATPAPASRHGGSITLNAFDLTLGEGAVLDVSGGYHLAKNGNLSAGDAGSISLSAGRDPALASVVGASGSATRDPGLASAVAGDLTIDGARVLGWADIGARAGSLSLSAPFVRIGGDASADPDGTLRLDTAFFDQGGFSSFSVTGMGGATNVIDVYQPGLVIGAGTTLAPKVGGLLASIGSDGSILVEQTVQAEGVRQPVSLAFRASGATNPFANNQPIVRGELELAAGASIITDAGGSVSFSANVARIFGSVTARGGEITVAGGSSYQSFSPNTLEALPTVLLGEQARLDVSGVAVATADPQGLGRRLGTIFGGGDITVSGNIIAREGAVLAASGSSGVLDLAPAFTPGLTPRLPGDAAATNPVLLETSGGSISLEGADLLASDATLVARAGGAGAEGGTLSVSSGRFYRDDETSTTADITLTVIQSGATFASGADIGDSLTTAEGNPLAGGRFAIDRFSAGGFDHLVLDGNVRFEGPVSASARGSMRVATGGVVSADASVSLSAPLVTLGQSLIAPIDPTQDYIPFTQTIPGVGLREYNFSPTHGAGVLNIDAKALEIGTLSFDGIGRADLNASGDIRGNGYVNIAGDLRLEAGHVYPISGTSLTFTAFNHTNGGATAPGSITIASSGAAPDLPASAAGTLSLYAAQIEQGGVLRAPFGVINLGRDATTAGARNKVTGGVAPVTEQLTLASGSVTSVSALRANGTPATLPYGVILNGTSWIDPRGVDITLGGLPEKNVVLSGADIVTEAGSVIDVRGGGDLLAYSFVPGNGGSLDILAASGAFAIIPGDQSLLSDFAPYNPASVNDTLGGDSGYTNSNLSPGDQIVLPASPGLPAGTYTLLPARYALLPGAFLVTPASTNTGAPIPAHTSRHFDGGASAVTPPSATTRLPDGSTLAAAQVINGFTGLSKTAGVSIAVEIVSRAVLDQRAEYQVELANNFLGSASAVAERETPRLPRDSGRLVFSAANTLDIAGSVSATPGASGRGGEVDISSSLDIRITAPDAAPIAGSLNLDASALGNFGAASLLIGGLRTSTAEGASINVTSRNLTLDNAGAPLVGGDVILVARESLVAESGADIRANSATPNPESLLVLGDQTVAGSGDGALIRVTANSSAPVSRLGLGSASAADLVIADDVLLRGGAVLLDSAGAASLSADARIESGAVSLNSGSISLVLDDAGDTSGAGGLVLGGDILDSTLASARSLSLLSYSSIDLYGTGVIGSENFESLSINTPALRRVGTGDVTFVADNILIGNQSLRAAPVAASTPVTGTVELSGNTVTLGAGTVASLGFATTRITAGAGVVLAADGGIDAAGDIAIHAPLITGSTGADQSIRAASSLVIASVSPASPAPASDALGARLALSGADVRIDSTIRLQSGRLEAEARAGDLIVGGRIDVSGAAKKFFDQTRVTEAGDIHLKSTQGVVRLGATSSLDLSAPSAVGEAGILSISSQGGAAVMEGALIASGAGRGGAFELDTKTLASTASLDATLNAAGFDDSREYRVRSGDVAVDGAARSDSYRIQADGGSIRVTGAIDASGATGGSIDISASGGLTLASGAVLDASAKTYDNAGKGSAISLAAGSHVNGVASSTARLALETGSRIDLSVTESRAGDESLGRLTGTLRLRAPVTATGTDIQADAIGATIEGASYVSLEGYRVYDLTASGGTITTAIQNQIRADGQALLGAAGATTAGYTVMRDRLLALQPGLADSFVLRPGAEIINRTGNLTLGATSSTATADWNLATFRFGPDAAPGVLTLRAAGDIVLHNALSDGFAGGASLWLSPLMAYNAALPVNLQSWDLRLTAGADLRASDFRTTLPEAALGSATGNVIVGKNTGAAVVSGGNNALTSTLIANNFQVIRTGSGDIDVTAARNIRLQNPFAAIYTAGTAVANATSVHSAGDFIVPVLVANGGTDSGISQGNLGSRPQTYFAQYSMAGGDVTLSAGENIERTTRTTSGVTVADSSRQLPANWLYRRGHVDTNGAFGSVFVGNSLNYIEDTSASTTWWVDFSNFFSDVGALGGGNVTLVAGNDVANVGAAIPTNARMPSGTPDSAAVVELGGGDLVVEAGRNIDGGVYYVQRGRGELDAGAAVTTNATRSINTGILQNLNSPARLPESTWMPTTLFVGDAVFDVSARGDVLLGPIANPHLMPQGNGNRFWYKTWFSTYGSDAAVEVASLTGDVNLRNEVTLPATTTSQSFLAAWLTTQNLLATGTTGAAYYQPWLRLAETSIAPFTTATTILPPELRVSAFSGDINLAGNFNLFPSATGTVDLLAAQAINALSPNGQSTRIVSGQTLSTWQSSRINLSDANPASIPGVANPLSYYGAVGSSAVGQNNATPTAATNAVALASIQSIARPFAETGATNAALQTRQSLHASGLLHRDDRDPIYLYAGDGDISGLTLFSAKTARVVAERDITDVALYIQNNREDQISVVSAGRDIVAYASNSALRVEARSTGNALNNGQQTLAGDIQISGPGSLQVIAGRHLDLGVGASGSNGTSAGVTSVGNLRNPHLPQTGADLLLAAGVGGSIGLGETAIDYAGFIAEFLDPAAGANSVRYLPELAGLLPADAVGADTWTRFRSLSAERQAELATEIFHLVLRDAGRDYNNPEAETYRKYTLGYEAIESLFPGKDWNGDISLTSRRIATAAGGDITILVPGGELTVGLPVSAQSPDQGVLTQAGGDIAIFADGSVNVGTSRIFTLRGGDISIWSTKGDIAAGSAAKTVRSAPPTRVVIDPQSAAVETDLSGLATGGGIGVLQTVAGIEAGDVDLIAPEGTIDAGDAGIRSAGNLNLAAAAVLNAANIQTGGTSVGAPAAPAAPNLGALTSASSTTAVASGSALPENRPESATAATSARDQLPSLFNVEVLGYGGGEDEDDSAPRGSS